MNLLSEHKKAVDFLLPFIREGEFYLAGGTAVYYYLGQRESLDLGFFTKKSLDFSRYQHLFLPHSVLFFSNDTIHAQVDGTRVSFFLYPYALLRPTTLLDPIELAHLEDILCMKVNAIINRGSRKDFTDVYFIMKELRITAKRCVELFIAKYGAYNPLVVSKAMSYFEDAENEPELKALKPVSWQEVKDFFITRFTEL
jgi:hypothetical protein